MWYDVRMIENALASLAQFRLDSFIRKVYGSDAKVSPEIRSSLDAYLKRGSFSMQFFHFMMTCDEQEEKLLQPKSKLPKRTVDSAALNLIDLAREYPF